MRCILKIVKIYFALLLSFSIFSFAKEYGEKKTLELNGSICLDMNFYENSETYELDTTLGVKYFFKDNFSIGLTPNMSFRVNNTKLRKSGYYNIVPFLSLGYLIKIKENLYYEIAPEIGICNHFFDYHGDDRVYYGINNFFKYTINKNSILFANINMSYIDFFNESYGNNYINIKLYLGYSFWFNLK